MTAVGLKELVILIDEHREQVSQGEMTQIREDFLLKSDRRSMIVVRALLTLQAACCLAQALDGAINDHRS